MTSPSAAPPIVITKSAPPDKAIKRVLIDWFKVTRPKWQAPVNMCAGTFFVGTFLYFLTRESIPPFAWLSLFGALVCFSINAVYMPILVSAALKNNKRIASYYQDKIYTFYPDHMVFSAEGYQDMELPLDRFTKVVITKYAVLFMIKEKLALWFILEDVPLKDMAEILIYLENNGVKVSHENKI